MTKNKNYKYGQYAVVNLHGIPATTTKTVYDQTLEKTYSNDFDFGYVPRNNSNKEDIFTRKEN
jgi:hypothetical protein